MYETASKRVYKSKHCVLFMTFRPSQRTLFMARRNWVLLALKAYEIVDVTKNQNGVRTALNNVTLVRPVVCRSIYMYPWALLLGYIGRVCKNVI